MQFHRLTLDGSVTLLDHVIQVFALPWGAFYCERFIRLHRLNYRWVSGILVHSECFAARVATHSWRLSVLSLEHFTKKSCGCLAIPLLTECEVQGVACLIHRLIRLFPIPSDLARRFINAPCFMCRRWERTRWSHFGAHLDTWRLKVESSPHLLSSRFRSLQGERSYQQTLSQMTLGKKCTT